MRYINKILAISILSLFIVCGTVCAKENDIKLFWTSFRESVLADDIYKIVYITNFPFVVDGYLDEDPKQKISKELFIKIFPKLLRHDAGISAIPIPMNQLIKNTKSIDTSKVQDDKSFRVGIFEFQKISGKWMFTQAYYGD